MKIINNKAIFSQEEGTIKVSGEFFVLIDGLNTIAANYELEGVPLLVKTPDIDAEAEAYADSIDRRGTGVWQGMYRGYIKGYKAHAETHPFTEVQLIEAFEQGKQMMFMDMNNKLVKYRTSADYLTHVRQPQIPERLVLEVEKISRCCGRCDGVDDLCYTDMTCDKHNIQGCEECYGKTVGYKLKSDNGIIYY